MMHEVFGIILFCIGAGIVFWLFRTYHITLDEIGKAIYDNHVIRMGKHNGFIR